jgi:hypothetical protein
MQSASSALSGRPAMPHLRAKVHLRGPMTQDQRLLNLLLILRYGSAIDVQTRRPQLNFQTIA